MTIDTKDLKVGDKVLIEATIDLISRDMTAIRVKDKASGADFYFSLDQIHSILPREPQVGEVWLDRSTNYAFKIEYISDDKFLGKFADGELFLGILSEVPKRFKFIPPEQHKEYGFE